MSGKFMRVTPGITLLIVLASLVSQFALVVAMLLPLKVVILLGSDNVPAYFPDTFSAFSRDVLIGWLCAAAVGVFLLHLFSEKVIRACAGLGAGKLLASSHKVALFANQNDLAVIAFQRYANALANGVFALLAVGLVALIYWQIAIVQVAYMATVLSFLHFASGHIHEFRERIDRHFISIAGALSKVGFLLVFSWIVVDFIFWSPPSPLVAIISLLLARQIAMRVQGAISDIRGLIKQQSKLDALFFHGKLLLPDPVSACSSSWSLLAADRLRGKLLPIMQQYCDKEIPQCWEWQQTSINNIIVLSSRGLDREGGYLIKIFERNRSLMAHHEATLLEETYGQFPGLSLLGVAKVDGFHCHFYRLGRKQKVKLKQAKIAAISVLTTLVAVDPPQRLVRRYCRSHPLLWQRINMEMIARLRLVVNSSNSHLVEGLNKALDELQSELSSLPLSIINPDLKPDNLMSDDDGEVFLVNWGRWGLEPLGAGWPVKRGLRGLLEGAVNAAAKRRGLEQIPYERFELAALAFEFERRYKRERFDSAIQLIPRILSCINTFEPREAVI
ncbi:hypothetical protein [Microbulbifer magnicolonia]|uniref:hypothetical protein n=1 Tax=Microbulbifer magnicolonia TaxID=3109744 RepID=UPI002B4080D5|nr:hypothetical protein [Microbulbifer sp. GG15]